MSFRTLLYRLFPVLLVFSAHAQTNIGGVINDYSPVTALGCNFVVVNNPSLFAVGNRVLLIQMQGSSLVVNNNSGFGSVSSYDDAGHYEFADVASINGNTIYFQFALVKTYTPGVGRVQLIRVPQYTSANVISQLTCTPWNGTIGGVLAMEVSGTLSLAADIDVSGNGFRGGTQCTNPDGSCGIGYPDYFYAVTSGFGAQKGESIQPLQNQMDGGRGAWGNGGGGGNKHNSGGGGGGNYTAGGKGGNQANFCAPATVGGIGGYAMDYSSGDRVFLGGGGGCSDNNNGVGTVGANGGGIIIIKAGTLSGNSDSILSNGSNVGIIPNGIGDGAGGAGGGGTILLDVGSYSSFVNITANGGHGGDQNTTYGACFGPGGGGGAGVIWFSQSSTPANTFSITSPGNSGIDLYQFSGCYMQSYGAQNGASGNGVLNNLVLPEGTQPGPVVDLGSDSSFCTGAILLDAGNPGCTYLWSTGATTQTINALSGGTFWVIVTSPQGCQVSDTVNFSGNILFFDLGPDTVLCGGGATSLVLDATAGNATYTWSTGATTPTISVNTSGTYSVTVSSGSCMSSDAIAVDFVPAASDSLQFPNVFTPNSDQKNDFFAPLSPPGATVDLKIFDRWGVLIYESHDANPAWDGRDTKGNKTIEGTYYWIAHYKTGCSDLHDETKTGFVSLFRK